MEAYIRIFENGQPLSVDELRGYEVCSIVDEIADHLLNSRKNRYYYDVLPNKHTDYLVVHCIQKDTNEQVPFPDSFRVFLNRRLLIHPPNYGLGGECAEWGDIDILIRLVSDDNTLHTTSPEPEQEHSK
jgi:hypothetical protein